MKIKRFLQTGELNTPLPENLDELMEQASACLNAAYACDILGQVVFEGEDGKFYVANVECEVSEANPDFLKEVLDEIDEEAAFVVCKFCEEETFVSRTHLHGGQYVCEDCWDERLRSTE